MVLPKDLREKAQIKPGDKLALVTWEKNGSICCISLVKSDEITGMLKKSLEPMVSDIIR
jgi:bifunctional DNA-binding transcriptional regulator/antitoxin component of YhaV-PrlF toxin-antitoxin module